MADHILDRLASTIRSRSTAEPGSSYVATLFAKGRGRIAQKVGEEAVETVIASMAVNGDIASEAADLVFHLTVLLVHADLSWADVLAELERREGMSGLAEKAGRPLAFRPE